MAGELHLPTLRHERSEDHAATLPSRPVRGGVVGENVIVSHRSGGDRAAWRRTVTMRRCSGPLPVPSSSPSARCSWPSGAPRTDAAPPPPAAQESSPAPAPPRTEAPAGSVDRGPGTTVPAPDAPVAPIEWEPCGARRECATYAVPVDHDDPGRSHGRPRGDPASGHRHRSHRVAVHEPRRAGRFGRRLRERESARPDAQRVLRHRVLGPARRRCQRAHLVRRRRRHHATRRLEPR